MCRLREEAMIAHRMCISLASALFVDLDEIVSRRCRVFPILMMLGQFDVELLVCSSRWNLRRSQEK